MNPSARFDVVVVGAGPAGSAAAAVLADAGVSVALVDKACFPRDKLCGGLLSRRSTRAIRDVFGADCVLPIEATATGAAVFVKDQALVRAEGCPPLFFTSRRTFDAHLVAQALARGAVAMQGTAVASIDADAGVVSLSDGSAVSATYIIGADGAASRVRKQLGVLMDRDGFAVGLEVEVPRGAVTRDVVDPEIYFGVAEWGYGWVFPKRHTLTVGVGGLAAANDDMRALFREFAVIALGRVPEQPACGSPIPFGNFVSRPGRGSTLLVGDAAGLVEPLTGEGIAFAVLSGFHAARAIVKAIRYEAPTRALEFYSRGYRSIVESFEDVRLLRRLVFSTHTKALFLRALAGNRKLVQRHMDVLAGETEYRDYARFALAETLTRLPRFAGSRLLARVTR